MNVDSEQITLDNSLVLAQDQPLSNRGLQESIMSALGGAKCKVVKLSSHKWAIECIDGGRIYHLLVRPCTYLGNPHPIYKKRIQLPKWFNDYVRTVNATNPDIDVRYIGVYHYGDEAHGDNVIFIDFKKDTYLLKKGHNSSAHVYVNDLYQGMIYGIFNKSDYHGNDISVARRDKFASHLFGTNVESESLFDLFRRFNCGFSFGQWLRALDAIKEMHQNAWRHWRQAEWAGWFLEYRFDKFTNDHNVGDRMRYVGGAQKRDGNPGFDVKFENENFYGDFKASDIKKKESPANDKDNLIDCIYRYGKFWYIIYEHETIKDCDLTGYEATKARNHYIRSVDATYNKGEMSYARRMKNMVKFVKMSIIELNRVNFREALIDFNQGRQPSGRRRKPKFNINKKVLENDNFVIFRYTYKS